MSRRKSADKNNDGQLFFDFDNPGYASVAKVLNVTVARQDNPFVFPKDAKGISVLDTLALCMGEIQEFLSHSPENLSSWIFKHYFVLGTTIKEMAAQEIPHVRIPSKERIRQIAESIATDLSSGKRCSVLHGVRLSKTFLEEIREFKESGCGIYIDSSVMNDEHLCRLQGIAYFLSMRIIEAGTVLPILSNCFLLSEEKSVEVFRSYYKMLVLILQEEVRPLRKEQMMAVLAEKMNQDEIDASLVDLILKDCSVFDVYEGDDDQIFCKLKFMHLKVYQQLARIIYEKKSISINDLTAEMQACGSDPKAMSLSLTCKKFPWCVPMGKTRWIYKEDGQKMDRIQDVIKEYSEQHIRFSFDEIQKYLLSRQYNMIEASIRNYIMKYCRRNIADKNSFCLTSMVPPEEDKHWYKKHISTKRNREVAYHKELIQLVKGIITNSPAGYVPRKMLKKQVAYIFEEKGVNDANFYKIINASNILTIVEIDGEICVKLAEGRANLHPVLI